MKQWNTPDVKELNIAETANGFININWEGPLDIVFGKEGNSTPDNGETDLNS